MEPATNLQIYGAVGFGMIIGWYVYYVNRYRKGDVQFSDITTVISILGGGVIVSLFPAQTDLFGGYGLGLAIGFFGYFLFLNTYVAISSNFNTDWFLDGRRKKTVDPFEIPGEIRETVTAMTGEENDPDRE